MNYYHILCGFILGMAAAVVAVVFVLYRFQRDDMPGIEEKEYDMYDC